MSIDDLDRDNFERKYKVKLSHSTGYVEVDNICAENVARIVNRFYAVNSWKRLFVNSIFVLKPSGSDSKVKDLVIDLSKFITIEWREIEVEDEI